MKNKIKVFNFITIVLIFILSATSCSGQSGGGGKSLNSAEELKKYLDSQPANGPDKPIKVSMTINDPMLKSVADIIKSAGKYVSLNITGNALTEIPYITFYECKTLVGITIPNSVTEIGNSAFLNCTSLTSVTLGNSVKRIGDFAFINCSSLPSITIPNSVTTIKDQAFRLCTSLTSVTFEGTISSDNLVGMIDNFVGMNWLSPFDGDLRDKYLAGGIGTYTTTTPVPANIDDWKPVWTKK